MTTAGWIMMGISLTIVWVGTVVCYKLILADPKGTEKVPPGYGA